MEQQPNYIVFQCYGSEDIFHECGYALLSLSRLYPKGDMTGMEIWIYTDNPGWFRSFKGCTLPLHYRTVDSKLIQQWKGSIDFVHRVKIEVLKDMTLAREGNILYADTDVVFTQCIDSLFANINAGGLYMHVAEGVVSKGGNPILAKLNNYLRNHVPMTVNGRPIQDLAMWNAGVIGFNTRNKAVLDEALAFTDREYPKFPKHVVEQFAFSVYMQQAGEVKTAAPYILHYWNLKEARQVLRSFFKYFNDKSWDELVRYSALIQMPVLMQEKVNFLHNRSIAGKLLKKHWAPHEYQWEELVKQL